MRIALIAPPWTPVPPPGYGGTELVVDGLARELTAAGHQVLLATTGDSTCSVTRTWVYDRARTADMGDTVVELTHVLHAYEAIGDADIIHDHTSAGPALASQRSTPPVVTTNHAPFTEDVRRYYRALGDHVAVVAISHHQASTAGDVPIARVIHHGIDQDRYPVGPGGDHLVFDGRMSPDKGVRQAIDIAKRAGVPLVIAAKMRTTGEREYFEAEVKPHLGGDIHYAGEVDRSHKHGLVGGALALLNPIRWDEPFGLNMIEALACGTPVIAAPRGAAPELVDHGTTGFLATTTDEAVAAIAWVATLDRHACRTAAETRFSAHRMAADHLALYHDIITGRTQTAA